jgi:hypothetical protein
MPSWLWKSIAGTCSTILLLVVVQWAACRFYVIPSIMPLLQSKNSSGKIPDLQLLGCTDTDSKTVAVGMSVLTTLISLSRKAE